MNIINALNWRYSVKRFSEHKLQPWQIDKLLEATRLSPSSYGLQPYKIIIIESEAVKERLLPFAYDQQQVAKCSHLLVFATRTDIGAHLVNEYVHQAAKNKDISPDSLANYAEMTKHALANMDQQQSAEWAQHQTYIALGTMLTSAATLNIDTCPIGGFEPEKFDSILGLSQKHLAATVICPIGIRHPEDKYSKQSKVRFAHQHLVMEM